MKKERFNQRDTALGSEYITPCPNKQKGKYTSETIMVGSRACRLCPYYGGIAENYVKCNFDRYVSILQKNKKDILD